ncbi:methylmalonyl-CoA mutase subunit beta [Leeuwenhoekiella sp. NPDC079379]|uniref:methylmalonyl-CoA mutase subunit beta n=1 Tax=Leeuwenhoekiella sp. NPDC079379 TaxID=3364122 RepID=UPI0037C97BAD
MDNSLYSDFNPVTAKAFKQKIQYDLAGADYNETLLWSSPEGIHIKPFYHREDLNEISIPGHPTRWSIAEEIYIQKPETAALKVLELLSKGVEAFQFKADQKFNIDQLLETLPQQNLTLYFNFSFLDVLFFTTLSEKTKDKEFTCFLNTDIIGNLARSGNWFSDLREDRYQLKELILNAKNDNVVGIDSSVYHNAGATIIQELAYLLAQTNEYFNHYGDLLKKQLFTLTVAIGSNYFFEIAKIRALRLLYATLASEYGLPETCHIIAKPALRNKVLYDYNTNMLRTTTECMSAVLGGADSICNLAYDAIYHKTNDFGQRIARNQLLLLKHESYFDLVSNPADGTYYIENLTQQFAEQALSLFKDIEAGGGFVTQLIEGKIQKKIKTSAAKEQEAFDKGEKLLVGTNTYQNPDDRMKHDLDLYPFLKMNPRKTLIEPVITKRLAEEVEQKRLKDE